MLMLYRAFNLGTLSSSTTENFADVSGSMYYDTAINKARALGIANGQQGLDGKYYFNPESNITREEAFTLLYRTMQKLNYSVPATGNLNNFSDGNQVQSYAQNAVKAMLAAGVVTGNVRYTDYGSATYIDPASNVTRAQMAVMLHRALTK